MLWLALTLMLLLASLMILPPLLKKGDAGGEGRVPDVGIYREQLAELEGEVARGAITRAEADETRREIERRVLAAARQDEGLDTVMTSDRVRLAGVAITLAWVVMGSAYLYSIIGSPGLPARQVAALAPGQMRAPAAAPAPTSPQPAPAAEAPAAAGPGDVNSLIDGLARRLENEPDDLEGWRMLAWSYLNTENYGGAAEAYARAVTLDPDNAELRSLYGEAVTRANGGVVDARAQEIFDATLRLDPGNPRAGFFKGLALDQAGDSKAALDLWLGLLETAPEGADWVPGLITRIRERASATGYDLAGRLPTPGEAAPKTPAPEAQPLRAPTAEEIEAARQLSGQDRQAMIQGMVAGLAARLSDDPNDPQGWIRLIRSYVVLGDQPAVHQALATARETFAGQADILAPINKLAAEQGLE